MSAPRSLNTFCMPPCDAMPASLARSRSKIGPSISVRRYSICIVTPAPLTGSSIDSAARRVASTFLRLVLKNW